MHTIKLFLGVDNLMKSKHRVFSHLEGALEWQWSLPTCGSRTVSCTWFPVLIVSVVQGVHGQQNLGNAACLCLSTVEEEEHYVQKEISYVAWLYFDHCCDTDFWTVPPGKVLLIDSMCQPGKAGIEQDNKTFLCLQQVVARQVRDAFLINAFFLLTLSSSASSIPLLFLFSSSLCPRLDSIMSLLSCHPKLLSPSSELHHPWTVLPKPSQAASPSSPKLGHTSSNSPLPSHASVPYPEPIFVSSSVRCLECIGKGIELFKVNEIKCFEWTNVCTQRPAAF